MLCTCEKDNTEVRSFNDLLFGYSPFHCQRFQLKLELKFLSVSWHFRRCFELNHRIVLERSMKGHRSPFMVSYGIVYKIKLRWRSNNSSTLHTEETLITCCFKETKKKSKNNWQPGSLELGLLHLLFNHWSSRYQQPLFYRFFYGVSKTEIKTKFASTSNRGRNCLFSQNETTILVMQHVQFEFPEFRQVSSSLSLAVIKSTVATAS